MTVFTIGAFAVVFDEQGRVLLCHRRDMDAWNLPGGGVASRELPTEAVIRETREETGLVVEVEKLVEVIGKIDKDELVFVFLCRCVGGQLSLSDEADQCEYFSIANVPSNTLPKHVERITDATQSGTQPLFRRQTAPSAKDFMQSYHSQKL